MLSEGGTPPLPKEAPKAKEAPKPKEAPKAPKEAPKPKEEAPKPKEAPKAKETPKKAPKAKEAVATPKAKVCDDNCPMFHSLCMFSRSSICMHACHAGAPHRRRQDPR